MIQEECRLGQVELTVREQTRVPLGNQYTECMSIVEYQCIKAAAVEYDVADWISKIDFTLTHGENIELLRRRSTCSDGGPTCRELPGFCARLSHKEKRL